MARNTTQKGGRFAPATTTAKSNNGRVERLVFTRLADAQLLLNHGNPDEATRRNAAEKVAFAQWLLRENADGKLEGLSDVVLHNRFLEATHRR